MCITVECLAILHDNLKRGTEYYAICTKRHTLVVYVYLVYLVLHLPSKCTWLAQSFWPLLVNIPQNTTQRPDYWQGKHFRNKHLMTALFMFHGKSPLSFTHLTASQAVVEAEPRMFCPFRGRPGGLHTFAFT